MSEEHVGTICEQNAKNISMFVFYTFPPKCLFFHDFPPQISWAAEVPAKCQKCQKNLALFDFPNFEELYLRGQKELEGVLGL